MKDFTGLNNEPDAKAHLLRCCASHRWVEAMLAAGPFPDMDAVHKAADTIWWQLDRRDWLEAFTGHPKIGDLNSLAKKFADTASLANQEQAGTVQASEKVLAELRTANQAYQVKFGYIFIVYATDKSAAQMLAILQSRLHNDPNEEIRIAAGEQLKITQRRLEQWQ